MSTETASHAATRILAGLFDEPASVWVDIAPAFRFFLVLRLFGLEEGDVRQDPAMQALLLDDAPDAAEAWPSFAEASLIALRDQWPDFRKWQPAAENPVPDHPRHTVVVFTHGGSMPFGGTVASRNAVMRRTETGWCLVLMSPKASPAYPL